MKPFKNIRISLIKGGNIKRYLLYAIGEVLLVMIGISLAFQADNWNEDRLKKDEERSNYQNIRDQSFWWKTEFVWGTEGLCMIVTHSLASVTIWPGGPCSPVRIITQVPWFMYQNRFTISINANECYDFIRIRNLFSFSTAQTEKNSQKKVVKQICENIWWIRYKIPS